MKHIVVFYAIEIRGRSAEERRLVRQQKSGPLADSFEGWPRAKVALISQKIKLAEAIRYALSRRQGLTRVIELDNNTVERSISSTKLRRKNALFADSDGGAEHRAVVTSLVKTCKLNGVDPLAHLTDVPSSKGLQAATSTSYCVRPTALKPSKLA
nr:transposase [Bradyrhizobium sp. 160]